MIAGGYHLGGGMNEFRTPTIIVIMVTFVTMLVACSTTSSDLDGQTGAEETAGSDAAALDSTSLSDTTSDGPCVASCTGKVCGTDGCGGFCGQCAPDTPCVNGQCADGDLALTPDMLGDVAPQDTWSAGDLFAYDLFDTMAWDTGEPQDTTGWDGGSWDSGYGDGGSWDYGYWDGGYWDGYVWDGGSWDGYEWEGGSWDGYDWDGVSWDLNDAYYWDYVDWDDADYDWGSLPDFNTDSGPLPDGSGGGCGPIPWQGICKGNILKWCAGDVVIVENCDDYGPGCKCSYSEEFEFTDCFCF